MAQRQNGAFIGMSVPQTPRILGPFYQHELTSNPAWMSNYIHYNVSDEITFHS